MLGRTKLIKDNSSHLFLRKSLYSYFRTGHTEVLGSPDCAEFEPYDGGFEVFKFSKGGLVEGFDSPRAQIKLKGRLWHVVLSGHKFTCLIFYYLSICLALFNIDCLNNLLELIFFY
jgi:hypothetical protein